MYNNPVYMTTFVKDATISTAGTLATIVGPQGKTGRIEAISAVVTTSTTVAASVISVGTAADGDKFGTLSIPIAAAGAAAAFNNATINKIDDNLMDPDTAIVIASDGGSTAGAADISVVTAWF